RAGCCACTQAPMPDAAPPQSAVETQVQSDVTAESQACGRRPACHAHAPWVKHANKNIPRSADSRQRLENFAREVGGCLLWEHRVAGTVEHHRRWRLATSAARLVAQTL